MTIHGFSFIRANGDGTNIRIDMTASDELLRFLASREAMNIIRGITGIEEGTQVLTDEDWDLYKRGLEAFGFVDVTLERDYKGLHVKSSSA